MKKVNWLVVLAGAAVGIAAVALTLLGNPVNMGFCIACFLRDIVGACGMHGAAVVQYVRPEIVGIVLGAVLMAFVGKEFKPKGGSSPFTRFLLGVLVMAILYGAGISMYSSASAGVARETREHIDGIALAGGVVAYVSARKLRQQA